MHVSGAVRRGCFAALLVGVTGCAGAADTSSHTPAAASASASCAGRVTVRSLKLPYCTNRPLRTRDTGVRRLVIVVHGTQRNASDYERFMLAAARAARVRDALVVAPHFLDGSDHPGRGVLHWSSEGWKQGDQSQTSPS